MAKRVVNLAGAPALPFSPAVKAGQFVFVSGQVGYVDGQGHPLKDTRSQVRQCLENLKKVLEAAGSSVEEVVKVTVFLRSEQDYATMNEVYRAFFGKDRPARATAIAGLVLPDMLVEIDAIAYSPAGGRPGQDIT